LKGSQFKGSVATVKVKLETNLNKLLKLLKLIRYLNKYPIPANISALT